MSKNVNQGELFEIAEPVLKPWQGGDRIDAPTPGPSRRTDPETSHAAGAAVAPRTGTWRRKVLEALGDDAAAGRRGLTDIELERRWPGARPQTIRTRRSELVAAGLVEDSHDRRLTDTGSMAIVWRLTYAGARELGISITENVVRALNLG
jgi:hypothetical protein